MLHNMLPGRGPILRVGIWPDCHCENIDSFWPAWARSGTGRPRAGQKLGTMYKPILVGRRRAHFAPCPEADRPKSGPVGRITARKHDSGT